MSSWPPGIYEGPPLLWTRLVVVNELPVARDTLLVRLLGAGSVLKQAIAELKALQAEAPERALALPILLRLRLTGLAPVSWTPADPPAGDRRRDAEAAPQAADVRARTVTVPRCEQVARKAAVHIIARGGTTCLTKPRLRGRTCIARDVGFGEMAIRGSGRRASSAARSRVASHATCARAPWLVERRCHERTGHQ
jgi:hypothetical protein